MNARRLDRDAFNRPTLRVARELVGAYIVRSKNGRLTSALVTETEATLKAIDAKDLDALSQAGDSVYLTCKACHDRYVDK